MLYASDKIRKDKQNRQKKEASKHGSIDGNICKGLCGGGCWSDLPDWPDSLFEKEGPGRGAERGSWQKPYGFRAYDMQW